MATMQIFGGAGFNSEYPVEKLMRDAKIFQVYIHLVWYMFIKEGTGREGVKRKKGVDNINTRIFADLRRNISDTESDNFSIFG